jgi:hypothetical protein
LPYKAEPTFIGALIGHAKLLKQLGVRPVFSEQNEPQAIVA